MDAEDTAMDGDEETFSIPLDEDDAAGEEDDAFDDLESDLPDEGDDDREPVDDGIADASQGAPQNLPAAIEALLFVSDEPVAATTLAEILEVEPGDAEEALAVLAADYHDQDRGIQLREVAGGWRFYSHPAYHGYIEKYILSWDTHKLSQAALEALAVIAYHQPVTRSGVNAIRGVNSEGVISSLVEKGLVREAGREKGPGAAILYATTRTFLEKFGLKSLKELPPLEDFAPDEESKKLIRERLSAGPMSTALEVEEDLEDDILAGAEDGSAAAHEGVSAEGAVGDATEVSDEEVNDVFSAAIGRSTQDDEADDGRQAGRVDEYPDMPEDNLGDTLDDDADDDIEEVE